MLIPSHRHTAADLEFWRRLESADRAHGGSAMMRTLIDDAVQSVRLFASIGRCYVGVSWGKDSVVLAHVVATTGLRLPMVHLRPTNHNPECDLVRDAFLARWPGVEYHEEVVDYGSLHASGLDDATLDKATDREWYAAIRRVGERFGPRHVLGIRSSESFGRRMRSLRWGVSSTNGCAPLAWWSTDDVFGCLAIHDLPTHPVYACNGGGRWPRERLRVAEIGDTHGKGGGRREWEQEYYGDELRRLEAGKRAADR